MQRFLSISFSFLLLFLMSACGGSGEGNDNGKKKDEKKKEATANMQKKDLSSSGLQASIMVPKKDPQKGIRPPQFEMDQRGRLVIKAGKVFGFSIFEGAPVMSMKEKKKEIRTMNQALETDFVEEKDGLLIYKYGVPGSDKEMFHFYMVHESKGRKYVIESLSTGNFTRKQVDRMISSARSLTPKKEKSA